MRTRHNAGFLAMDRLSEEFGVGEWEDKQKFIALVQEARIGIAPALLVKPQTYMNLSGDTIRKVIGFYKIDPATQIIVFNDDVDLPAGTFRFRTEGGPGTHNGLKSIVDGIGKGFPRIRIGIGPQPPATDLAAWVLSAFTTEEEQSLQKVFAELPDVVRTFVMEETVAHTNEAEE